MSFGRKIVFLFLIIMTIASIVYFLFIKKPNLTPSYCFDRSDKEILVLFNQNIDIDTLIKGSSREFYKKIKNEVKFKKVFFSKSKSKILVVLRKYQLQKGIENFLISIGLKFYKKNGYYELKNNWKCVYDESTIFFFKGKFSSKKSNLDFNVFDSDFTIYDLVSQKVFSYELKENNLVKKYDNHLNSFFLNKNDFNLYCKYIPNGIDSYTFYQKKYAEQNLLIERSSSYYKMLKDGFCIFNYNGHEYIIAEKKQETDPYLLFDEENEITEIVPGIRKKYEHTFLCSKTKMLNEFFYLEIFDNMMIFAESKEMFDVLYNLITEKKVLKYYPKDAQFIFGDQPREVILRNTNLFSKNAIVSSKHSFLEYTSLNNQKNKIKKETISNLNSVVNFLVGKKYLYVFTIEEIIKYDNDREIERVKYKGKIIGSPEIIRNQIDEKILFTTSEKLYCLNQDFKSIEGFPIILKNKPVLPFSYTNTKQNKLLGFSEKKIFSICDSIGNIQSKLKLELENLKKPISLFEADELSAVVYDDQTAYFIDLKINKIIDKIDLKFTNTVFLTNNDVQSFFYINDNKLFRNSFNGDLKKCASGKKLYALKCFSKCNVIGVLSDKNLAIFDANGDYITKVELPVKSNIDYTIVQNFDGQSYIIVLDRLSNLAYIYNFEGENVIQTPIKGSEVMFIKKEGRELRIYTVLKNKLLKYLI